MLAKRFVPAKRQGSFVKKTHSPKKTIVTLWPFFSDSEELTFTFRQAQWPPAWHIN